MRRALSIPLLTLTLAGSGFACARPEPPGTLARVGRHRVKVEAFQAYLGAAAGQPWQGVEDEVASRLLDQFLDQEVVAAAARAGRDLKIPSDPGARSATVRALLEEICGAPPPLEEAMLENEIARRTGAPRPRRAHVRQMLLDSREEAEEVARRLTSGEDFIELSRRLSRAPNAARGGEIGWVEEGSLPPELDHVIAGLASGESSAPVQGPSGYHVFQALEVEPSGVRTRAEVEPELRRELAQVQARRFTRECIDRLASDVGVVVLADQLWFSYDGRYGEARHAK